MRDDHDAAGDLLVGDLTLHELVDLGQLFLREPGLGRGNDRDFARRQGNVQDARVRDQQETAFLMCVNGWRPIWVFMTAFFVDVTVVFAQLAKRITIAGLVHALVCMKEMLTLSRFWPGYLSHAGKASVARSSSAAEPGTKDEAPPVWGRSRTKQIASSV